MTKLWHALLCWLGWHRYRRVVRGAWSYCDSGFSEWDEATVDECAWCQRQRAVP